MDEIDFGQSLLPLGCFFTEDDPLDVFASIWCYFESKCIETKASLKEWKMKFYLYDLEALKAARKKGLLKSSSNELQDANVTCECWIEKCPVKEGKVNKYYV